MKRLLVCAFVIFAVANAIAQERDFRKEYEAFRQGMIHEYESFRDSVNGVYVAFVRQAWEEYSTLPAVPKPDEPVVPPVVFPIHEYEKDVEDKTLPVEVVIPIDEPEPQPLPVSPIEEVPPPSESYFHFTFYGTDCEVRLDDMHRFNLDGCSEDRVAETWESMCSGIYDNVIRDCMKLRQEYQFCDWAYLQMLDTMAEAFYGQSSDETALLTAFLYCQTGYQMRLARDNGKLIMLFSSEQYMYNRDYFEIDGVRFYPLDDVSGNIEISGASFPAERPLSLIIQNEQKFALNASSPRTLQSERFKDWRFPISVNLNLVEFYDEYPEFSVGEDAVTRWAVYADVCLGEHARSLLYPLLKHAVSGFSQIEAVNRILNFVQTAFAYEYDDTVWGRDRAFFPEETLYYSYCDCEDRSILFSRLIRDIMGLDVILVYYPGHLAAAVAFTGNVNGDYLLMDGKKYVICDPTYIGAPVGYSIPGMIASKAVVITL